MHPSYSNRGNMVGVINTFLTTGEQALCQLKTAHHALSLEYAHNWTVLSALILLS